MNFFDCCKKNVTETIQDTTDLIFKEKKNKRQLNI